MSSHILALAPALARLWPFVLKRTLLQERTAGDYAMSNASFWLSATRDDLKRSRRANEELLVDVHDLTVERDQLQALVSVNAEVASIASWRKSAATIARLETENDQLRAKLQEGVETVVQLRADLKAAADTIVRLKGGA